MPWTGEQRLSSFPSVPNGAAGRPGATCLYECGRNPLHKSVRLVYTRGPMNKIPGTFNGSTARRSFSPRRQATIWSHEHGEWTSIGTYEQSFKILFVLRELRVSVVKHFFQWAHSTVGVRPGGLGLGKVGFTCTCQQLYQGDTSEQDGKITKDSMVRIGGCRRWDWDRNCSGHRPASSAYRVACRANRSAIGNDSLCRNAQGCKGLDVF
jgi:hypothetical protein